MFPPELQKELVLDLYMRMEDRWLALVQGCHEEFSHDADDFGVGGAGLGIWVIAALALVEGFFRKAWFRYYPYGNRFDRFMAAAKDTGECLCHFVIHRDGVQGGQVALVAKVGVGRAAQDGDGLAGWGTGAKPGALRIIGQQESFDRIRHALPSAGRLFVWRLPALWRHGGALAHYGCG